MAAELTISCIKADVGGFVGHSAIHPALQDEAGRQLEIARRRGMLIDFHVTACGDDLGLLMTHVWGSTTMRFIGLPGMCSISALVWRRN
jgi:D-fructose 1,6-bisphosphatase (EC 3.1.3.11)